MAKRRRRIILDCGCKVEVVVEVCEHYVIDLNHCPFQVLQLSEDYVRAREREIEEERQRQEESYWRSTAPIGSTRSFSLLKGGPNQRIQHGYDIRVWRYNRHHDMDYETFHAWGVDEDLPDEWYALKKDETVEYADIARNVERTKRMAQRRYRERHSRGGTKFGYWDGY